MPYKVFIRKNETGEIRETSHDHTWEESEILWREDANWTCDCNLEMFFQRSAGNNIPLDQTSCSNDRFTIMHVQLENGQRLIYDPETDEYKPSEDHPCSP